MLKVFLNIIILLPFILYFSFSSAQYQKIDTLLQQLKLAKQDSIKCTILLDIGDFYEHKNIDSALFYYEKSLKLAEQKSLKKDQAQAHRYIAALYIDNSDKTISLENYQKALDIYIEIKDKKGIAKTYNNIGLVYYKMGTYDVAIENFMKSLKMREENGDKRGMMLCYLNIGSVQKDQKSNDKAEEYYIKALNIAEELNDKEGIYLGNNNLGIMQDLMGNFEKALEYYNTSLKIVEELDDNKGILMCFNNLGISYKKHGDYENAIIYYNKALKISDAINNKNTSAMILDNIASLHLTLADSAITLKKGQNVVNFHLKSVLEYGHRAIDIGKEILSKPIENNVAKVLMKAYKRIGDKSKSLEYAEIFIDTKDSMFSQEKTKSLAEAEKKFESEKKQLQIEKLEKQKELDSETIARKNAESKKQRILIFSFFAGFIIILIFSIFLYRLFSQKRKANLLLAKQKQQIEIQNVNLQQANEEINAQRDEIEAQRDLVMNQKGELEGIYKEVTDSINYAKRIQAAVLPNGEFANNILGNHFIIFKPKDIVSGDFYWATRVNEWLIVTVADCTGHGVPGAFMSMLGVSFLNEIVRKKEVTKASDVLDNLRTSIIDALSQTGKSGTQKDGMDIVMCAINTNDNTMQFAGANNTLFIVKSKNLQVKSKENASELSTLNFQPEDMVTELVEVKGDKQPVAIYEHMTPFTNHIIQLNYGDTLYLMSDGYQDQFGGEKGKKFFSKNLKQLIIANCQLPMEQQKQVLETTLINWIGDGEQIDDITLVGIRI